MVRLPIAKYLSLSVTFNIHLAFSLLLISVQIYLGRNAYVPCSCKGLRGIDGNKILFGTCQLCYTEFLLYVLTCFRVLLKQPSPLDSH